MCIMEVYRMGKLSDAIAEKQVMTTTGFDFTVLALCRNYKHRNEFIAMIIVQRLSMKAGCQEMDAYNDVCCDSLLSQVSDISCH